MTVLTAAASYKMISDNLPRSLERVAAAPDVVRQTDYYLANIGKAKSIDDFLGNDRLYRYAMKAFGLEDMSYAKAFMRKVLEEGVDASDSFANSLSDKRYREFAEAFNFKSYGAATTAFDRTQQGTVDKYDRQLLEEKAGAEDEGVRLALYFSRKAPSVDSVFGLLADPALLKVTQTLAGLPSASGAMNIDKQATLISKRLDVADLKDPEKLKKLITHFTAMWEAQKDPAAAANGVSLLFGGSPRFSLSGDLLASIQNLRLGGS
jgi:hypothetical protein